MVSNSDVSQLPPGKTTPSGWPSFEGKAMCVYREDRIKVVHVTTKPRNLEDRLMVILALPLGLYQVVRDHVTVWWWDFKDMLRYRD
jgi:hypothetical protein